MARRSTGISQYTISRRAVGSLTGGSSYRLQQPEPLVCAAVEPVTTREIAAMPVVHRRLKNASDRFMSFSFPFCRATFLRNADLSATRITEGFEVILQALKVS